MKKKKTTKPENTGSVKDVPRCGLCGSTENLVKTPCCGNWICSDKNTASPEEQTNCSRNHRHYTICGYHYNEGHEGKWQECIICRDSFEPEVFSDFATNEFNFERLEDIPSHESEKCSMCGREIILSEGGFSLNGKDYMCAECTEKDFERELIELQKKALSEDD